MPDEHGFDSGDSSGVPGPQAASSQPDQAQVAFEIDFFAPVLERSPNCVEVLQLLGNHYTHVGRCQDGLAIDRRLVRLCPDDPVAHYNLACSLSLTGKPALAVREIEHAVRLGYSDLDYMDHDPDLNNIRHHPAYLSLMQKLRQP